MWKKEYEFSLYIQKNYLKDFNYSLSFNTDFFQLHAWIYYIKIKPTYIAYHVTIYLTTSMESEKRVHVTCPVSYFIRIKHSNWRLELNSRNDNQNL